MIKKSELPRTCLCQKCKEEVEKSELSETGLKWNKIICKNCESVIVGNLNEEVADGITKGDVLVMSVLQMLSNLEKNVKTSKKS